MITSELIPAARITSAGGTDTSTGNELPNLILISDVPEAGVESINVNAITTVLSVVETAEEKQALLTKLGIEGTPDDLIAKDIWAGSESGDQVSQRAQRINAQLNVVLTTASSIITGVDEEASPLAIVEAAASSVVTATADVEEVSLADAGLLETVLNETIETVAPDAQVDTEVIAAVSNAVADVNSVIADESIDPTSDTAAAVASAGQSELQESVVEVSSGGSDVTQFEEDTSSEVIFADVPVEDDAPDFDGDGIPDVTDPDDDNDGVRDGCRQVSI